MNANELKIGNLVMATAWRSDKLHITKVKTISKGWGTVNGKSIYTLCINHEFVETGCEFGPCIESDIHGIELTEEWLLKFGAIKKDDGEFDLFGYNVFTKCDDPVYFGQQGCCMIDKIKSGIKYVHELQNLYFALTGKEL